MLSMPSGGCAGADRAIERAQVTAGPEAGLEFVGLGSRLGQQPPLAENDRPGRERGEQQHREDDLHDEARVEDQREDGVRSLGFRSTPSESRCGMRLRPRLQGALDVEAGCANGRATAVPRPLLPGESPARTSPTRLRRTSAAAPGAGRRSSPVVVMDVRFTTTNSTPSPR